MSFFDDETFQNETFLNKPTLNKTMRAAGRNVCIAGALTAAILWSSGAVADVTGIFEADGMKGVQIEYRDDDHVRMRTPDGSYVIVTGGAGYMVNREDGQWIVYAMDDFRAMMERFGMAGRNAAAAMPDADASAYRMRDTGRTETIAGIRGTVHEVVVSDGWDEKVSGEVVLTNNRDAIEVYRGMMRITGVMGEMAGQQGMGSMMASMYGLQDQAILRADDDWRLASIERNTIPSDAFTLPAEPSDIPGMAEMFGNSAPSGNARGAANNAASGANAAGGQVAEPGASNSGWIVDEVAGAAADETRSVIEEAGNEARDSVTEGIRDGIRGLFGR